MEKLNFILLMKVEKNQGYPMRIYLYEDALFLRGFPEPSS